MDKRELYSEWYGELRADYREQKESWLALSDGMSLQDIIDSIIKGNNDLVYNFMQQKEINKINNKHTSRCPYHKRTELESQLAIVTLEFFKQYQYSSDNWDEILFLDEYSRFCNRNIHRQWYYENGKNKKEQEIPFDPDYKIFSKDIKDFQDKLLINIDLQKALNALSNEEKTIIMLYFNNELSQVEIAKELNIYQKKVSRIMIQALDKLRKGMEVNEIIL